MNNIIEKDIFEVPILIRLLVVGALNLVTFKQIKPVTLKYMKLKQELKERKNRI